MKTLKESNEEVLAFYTKQQSKLTGVACNICGTEMEYRDLNQVLLSNPPQRPVVCPNPRCGVSGLKVV